MEHAVALDLAVPRVVSDGGMVSMVSAIQIQNKKEFVRSLRSRGPHYYHFNYYHYDYYQYDLDDTIIPRSSPLEMN